MAVGFSSGDLNIVDWTKNTTILRSSIHSQRIGCFDWNPKVPTVIASGSKDKKIKFYDIRTSKEVTLQTNYHFGEICGLNWNQNGFLLASGGNDNLVNIWDIRKIKKPKLIIKEHRAAVRALKWCPWKTNLLGSGGGSGDMRLIIHNTDKNKVVKDIHTSSQVCAIEWDSQAQTIITAHGYSKYQMCIWDYKSKNLLYEFLGHRNRILSLVKPQNSNIVFSASSDETLRIWNISKYIRPLIKNNTILKPIQLR